MSDFEELVRVFRNEATERLEELIGILQAVESAEAIRSAKSAAHNLKGAALTVGAQIIAGPCQVFEEEFQAALNSGTLPCKVQLETWVQILTELKDIVGSPTLLPLNFGGLAELGNAIKDDAEYVRVSHPSASPLELVASNATQSTIQIGLARLESMRACLDRVKAAQVTLVERTAMLRSTGGPPQRERAEVDDETDILQYRLRQVIESSDSLHVLLDELRTLFDEACFRN